MASETSAAYFDANTVTDKTAADVFIPEIWSDEVIAAYKQSLKMAPLVKRLPMQGKKGDTIHIPKPIRGAASAKAESTAVTVQAKLDTDLDISINRHFEYSRMIEDIVDLQAVTSLRKFITDDAGYALANQVDTDLVNCGTGFGDGTLDLIPAASGAEWINTNSYYSNAAAGAAIYAEDTVVTGDNFTDLAFRDLIKLMDDANVPMDNRVCIIPPAARKSIMGLERYVSSDFRNDRTVGSGYIGEVYGVDFYVSTNVPIMQTGADNSATTLDTRACLFFHQDAIVLVEQMGVRSQTQYKQQYLADLFTADTVYGVQVYRPEAGFVLAIADE